MKKITSLIMAVLMLCTMLSVFAVPAFAEDEPTVIEPIGGAINIRAAGNYVIKDGEYTIGNFQIGSPINRGIVLTIPEGVTVTVNDSLANSGTLYVNGTLIVKASNANNMGTINVGCGGKLKGAIGGNGTFTYEEHTFSDGKCTKCDTPESEVGEDEPTEIVPAKGANLNICNKDDLIICENCEISNLNIGNSRNKGMSLTIPKNVTVRVNGTFDNYGTLYVNGTLIVTGGAANNNGTIHMGCGGKLKGAIGGNGTFTYEEHKFADGKCTKCDTPESEVGKDEPTEIVPEKGSVLTIYNKDDLIIRENCEIGSLIIGDSQNTGMSLTIPKDVTVRVNGSFYNYGTLHVYGTLTLQSSSRNNNGTIHVGCSGKIEGTIDDDGKTVKDEHELTNGFCACGYFDLEQHEHIFEDGKCACGESETVVGSILSDGNLWIIIAVAVIALGGIAAIVIVKKKKA